MPDSHPATRPFAAPDARRDGLGAVLALLALALPWNLHTGLGIGGRGWLFALLIVAALGTVMSAVLSHVGHRAVTAPDVAPESLSGMRLGLNVPNLVAVAGFAGYAVYDAFREAGTGMPPAGVGPAVWFAVAGALLCAQPVLGGATDSGLWSAAARVIVDVTTVLAVLGAGLTLYYRARRAFPAIWGGDAAGQNLTVVAVAVLYAVVALVPVVLAARWLRTRDEANRLTGAGLGVAVLIAGAVVWWLPAGRLIDAFHGVAQSTGTNGVGFEAYLAWAAVAAIAGPVALVRADSRAPAAAAAWRSAVGKGLLLVAVWAVGSAVLRIATLILNAVLNVPSLPYTQTALMAFDLLTAVLAGWLVVNGLTRLPKLAARSLLLGVLTLTVCRVVLGVALVPRVEAFVPTDPNAFYGSDLAQQITTMFDVVLCVLAALALAVELTVIERSRRQASPAKTPGKAPTKSPAKAPSKASAGAAAPKIAAAEPAAPRIATGATPKIATGAPKIAAPEIAASDPTPAAPKIADAGPGTAPQAAETPDDDPPETLGSPDGDGSG